MCVFWRELSIFKQIDAFSKNKWTHLLEKRAGIVSGESSPSWLLVALGVFVVDL